MFVSIPAQHADADEVWGLARPAFSDTHAETRIVPNHGQRISADFQRFLLGFGA
jgi:hypothetical protein